jgi:hypothetical protein
MLPTEFASRSDNFNSAPIASLDTARPARFHPLKIIPSLWGIYRTAACATFRLFVNMTTLVLLIRHIRVIRYNRDKSWKTAVLR